MGHIFGVVAEFNPFHNGHRALIRAAKRGGGRVVAVMSGSFVQRAQGAVTEKRVRAEAALLCGCDLVLELPLAYATATAERFAWGAVSILKACGCVDGLAFGSECGDAGALQNAVSALASPELPAMLRRFLDTGVTFARARELAARELFGEETAALLASPNNILAVEYLKAARALSWKPAIRTIKRLGVAHDSVEPSGGMASASYLRGLAESPEALDGYVPREALELYKAAAREGLWPHDTARLGDMMFSYLRRLGPEDMRTLPDLSEGVEDRLLRTCRSGKSMEEIRALLKTKRYPMSRVRRLLLCAFLGIKARDVTSPPPYLRVLGATAHGRDILSEMKGTAAVPPDTSLARLERESAACARFAQLESLATDLYAAALPVPRPCGYDYTASAVFPGKSGLVG